MNREKLSSVNSLILLLMLGFYSLSAAAFDQCTWDDGLGGGSACSGNASCTSGDAHSQFHADYDNGVLMNFTETDFRVFSQWSSGGSSGIVYEAKAVWGHYPPTLAITQYYSYGGNSCQNSVPAQLKTVGLEDKDKCISTCAGNPVDISTGNKYQTESDINAVGNSPLNLTRFYNSQIDNTGVSTDGIFGPHWGYTYGQQLYLDNMVTPTQILAKRSDGKTYIFNLVSGQWQSDSDVQVQLTETLDGTGTRIGWQIQSLENEIETYNDLGFLLTITDTQGRVVSFTYDVTAAAGGDDDFNTLDKITGPYGRKFTLTYAANGLVDSVTAADGHVIRYNYDTNDNLIDAAYPDETPADDTDNPKRLYHYEDTAYPNALTGLTDENGVRFATWAYDAQGRAILSEHAGGVDQTSISYNADGTTSVTEANGAVRTYTFTLINGVNVPTDITGDKCEGCDVKSASYDANGYPLSESDWNGNVTNFIYNSRGLETSRNEAVGTAEDRTITTQWHATYRLPTLITETGKTTAFSYDSVGRLLSRTETDTTTTDSRSWAYTYTTQGVLATVDGPRTDVVDTTTFDYDAQANLIQVTNALGHVTLITAHDAHGRPLTLQDANGLQTLLGYDARGRLQSRDSGGELVTFTYDDVGNLTQVTLPDSSYLAYGYDAAQRLTDISDQLGNQRVLTLDAVGNRIQEDSLDPLGTLTRTSSQVYDLMNQLVQHVGAATQATLYGYDANGNRISTQDPLSNNSSAAFDALNRLVQQTDTLLGVASYTYDARDNLTAVTDANGNTTTYSYDGLGNVTAINSPDTGVASFTFDAAGNVLTRMDAKGDTTTYQYDALNRLSQVTYQDATTEAYVFDAGVNGIGRLSSVTDDSGSTTWSYDQQGRITSKQQIIGSVTLTTGYSYDSQGRVSQMTYPSGAYVDYAYSNGELSSLSLNGAVLMNTIQYQPFGPISGWTWGNGTLHSRSYDLDGQLTQHSLGTDSRVLAYDVNGNITSLIDTLDTQGFTYDVLDRLIQSTGGLSDNSYTYDANGNRTGLISGANSTSYGIDTASNQLLQVTETTTRTYQYDATGNILNDGLHSFTYNTNNRLIGVDGKASYGYNALGQRVQKSVTSTASGDADDNGIYDAADFTAIVQQILGNGSASGNPDCTGEGAVDVRDLVCLNNLINSGAQAGGTTSTTLFAYDEAGHLIGEYDESGTVIRETVYLSDTPVAVATQGATYFIQTDHLGTPQQLTDSLDVVVWSAEYDPFGKAVVNEDPDGNGSLITFNQRLPGQYFDGETSLHYNYFRYYDPSTGRYITSDPIGLEGGLNTFGYVGGNPLSWTDPYGLLFAPNAPQGGATPSGNSCSSGDDDDAWLDYLLAGGLIAGDLLLGGPTGEGIGPALVILGAKEAAKNQIKKLSKGEIKKLIKKGFHPHDLKPKKHGSKYDLYKDGKGDVYVRPRDGSGPGDFTGINVNKL